MTILDSRLRGNERKVKLIKNKTGPLRARYSEPAWGAGDTSTGEQRLRTGRQTWEEHDSLATQRPRTMQSVLRAHNPAQHMPPMRRRRGATRPFDPIVPAEAGTQRKYQFRLDSRLRGE